MVCVYFGGSQTGGGAHFHVVSNSRHDGAGEGCHGKDVDLYCLFISVKAALLAYEKRNMLISTG